MKKISLILISFLFININCFSQKLVDSLITIDISKVYHIVYATESSIYPINKNDKSIIDIVKFLKENYDNQVKIELFYTEKTRNSLIYKRADEIYKFIYNAGYKKEKLYDYKLWFEFYPVEKTDSLNKIAIIYLID